MCRLLLLPSVLYCCCSPSARTAEKCRAPGNGWAVEKCTGGEALGLGFRIGN